MGNFDNKDYLDNRDDLLTDFDQDLSKMFDEQMEEWQIDDKKEDDREEDDHDEDEDEHDRDEEYYSEL
jgi:hypothetical protein